MNPSENWPVSPQSWSEENQQLFWRLLLKSKRELAQWVMILTAALEQKQQAAEKKDSTDGPVP